MKKILLFIITIVIIQPLKAQIILAGQQIANGFYYDISPDTVCNSGNSPFGFQEIYNIDLNDDGIIDFEINPLDGSGQMGAYNRCAIIPKNNNEIAMSITLDSCFGNPSIYPTPPHLANTYKLAQGFEINDTINTFANWKDSTALLSYYHWVIGRYDCSGGNFYDNSKYIGVRLFHNQDTLYGWIKIKDLSSTSVTVEEFACNQIFTSVKKNNLNQYKVYPNPTNNVIKIELDSFKSDVNISLTNNLGQLLLNQIFKSTNFIEINIDLPKGFYFLKISSSTKEHNTVKIIKE